MTSIESWFIMIPQREYDILMKSKKWRLTDKDWEILLTYEKEFTKFLEQSKLEYQLKLASGGFIDKEQKAYRSIETIDELKESLANIPAAMEKYRDDKAKKEEEATRKKEEQKNIAKK